MKRTTRCIIARTVGWQTLVVVSVALVILSQCIHVHAFSVVSSRSPPSLNCFRRNIQCLYQPQLPLHPSLWRSTSSRHKVPLRSFPDRPSLPISSPPLFARRHVEAPPVNSRLFPGRTERHRIRSKGLLRRFILVPLLVGLLNVPLRVLAATSQVSSTATSWKTWKQMLRLLLTKRSSIVRLLALSLAVSFTIRMVRLHRRQALDATSEWSRYANHPGARVRALGSLLCLQLLPLWIATRMLSLGGRTERAERMRTRTGNVFADGLLRLG